MPQRTAKRSLDKVFDAQDRTSIRQAYEDTVEFGYDEKKASRQVQSLTDFFDEVIDAGQERNLDEALLSQLRELYERLKRLLGK